MKKLLSANNTQYLLLFVWFLGFRLWLVGNEVLALGDKHHFQYVFLGVGLSETALGAVLDVLDWFWFGALCLIFWVRLEGRTAWISIGAICVLALLFGFKMIIGIQGVQVGP